MATTMIGNGSNRSKLATARDLAKAHFKIEPSLKRVFLLEPLAESDPREPIKLLEVVEGTIERGVDPVGFAPNPRRDIAYPTYIVEVSPREFEEYRGKPLLFEDQVWTIGEELLAS
jgi:hypothetical protein